ncbi:MAG: RIP metalloprotease RseP [Rhodanobacter sp.]|jgi:regulator of sigma E protease|nr:RIP metalloprotease RseP [Rhodanobacter sp.]ODT95623.1 MAG: RIP metalloprotease RseP [Rhodanobacter sp. SCN 67-45]OJW41349.1 MAG: RIP metalloprotease RseP [Rhodanobacter sp. 67-28]
MTSFFGSVFWLLVTLGVLVTFHEFGHYWVARRCGVKVLRFSIGFGKAIWKRIGRDGTEYWIAAIPLGGYVKMLDAREGEVDPALRDQEFTGKSVWKRIAIVAAGPGFNVIFTIAALWLMFMLGRSDYAPIVTATPDSIAAEAGIQPGDRILSVNGRQVSTWSDSMDAVGNALLALTPLPLTVRHADGQTRELVLPLDRLPAGQPIDQYFGKLGLRLAPPPAIAGTVKPGQPAALGGIQGGDRIVSINGQPVGDFDSLGKLVQSAAATSPRLSIGVLRDGRPLTLAVTATWESLGDQPAKWMLGVAPPPPEPATVQYSPARALGAAFTTTWRNTRQTFGMIGEMLSGHASTKNISSVIGIAQYANASAQMGLAWFLQFLAMVSLSLAILNLLPIPVLDGGHLLYYLIELVKGSPVSEQAMIIGQYIGLVLLFSLVGWTLFNDIQRTLLS